MSSTERPAALVTGGAVRLGRAIAVALAEAGYDIALHYGRSTEAAVETAEAIRELGVECEPFAHDLRDAEGLGGFLARVHERFPRLAALVNSASGYESGRIAETDVATFDAMLNVNLRAPFFLTQAFAASVERGAVVNIVDNKVGFHQFEYAAYLLSKKALEAFTPMAALEFAPTVRVNGVAPGVVLPASVRSEEYVQWRIEGIPLKMQGGVEHITGAVLFCLRNAFLTGQVITVDGGENLSVVGRNAESFGQ